MPKQPSAPWHTLPVSEVEQRLETDSARGLTPETAVGRLAEHGPNVLAQARKQTAGAIFFAQFRSFIVGLLGAATAIAFAMGDRLEAFAILVVIAINAVIGFATEWKAAEALSSLQQTGVRVAHVIRNGEKAEIPAAELVPGDLVVLAAGARVPADGRIVEAVQLQAEEAALTGESHTVAKTAAALDDPEATLGDRLNMAFLGTTITDGRGSLLVTTTGAHTEMGRIGSLIDEAMARETPLEQKLSHLGRWLSGIVLALCGTIVVAGWLRGISDFWHMLEIGLSLSIAAVPEGLPAVATMTLALGMQRMAKRRALVRRLPAVETLGCTTVICTDKTGTLTKNEMSVGVYRWPERRIQVTGTGYASAGGFQEGERTIDGGADQPLRWALRIGALCNDAQVKRTSEGETVLGDPTEAALTVAAEKAGIDPLALASAYPRLHEIPFSSGTKRMVTVHRTPEGRTLALVKGSPGTVLAASQAQQTGSGNSPMTPEDRQRWEKANQELADEALRVLGLAYRELPENYSEADLTRELVFAGLVGMSDPLREEAKAAIATCREAGIRTVMITGDQQATAAEIARQLNLDRDLAGEPLRVVHGRELADLDETEWKQMVAETAVFARVSPEHKLRIVEALQQDGQVVAMTGDGVNDAPALKKADIGIAMGIKGTEVAKENAAMVITDDNFASIVGAVEQGRIIYGNILRFLHYLLACNLAEILTVFVALMIGWPLPLAALQLLWLNFITDIFPAFALALEPSGPGMMKLPPRDPKEPLLAPRLIGVVVWQGMLLAGVTLFVFGMGMRWYGDQGEDIRRAATLAFLTLSLAQIFHVFNARSQKRSALDRLWTNRWLWVAVGSCLALQVGAVYVPLLQRLLNVVPPSAGDWKLIVLTAVSPIAVVELVKAMQRRWEAPAAAGVTGR